MSEDNIYKIPKRVNEPIMFAWWQFNHILVVIFALGFGMVTGMALKLTIGSIIYLKVAGYITEKFPKSRLRHLLWYQGILPTSGKYISTPDPLKREFFK